MTALRLLRIDCAKAGYLTPRQCEVLELLASGLLIKEAAYRLGISEQRTKNVLYEARRRAGVRTTFELLARIAWSEAA